MSSQQKVSLAELGETATEGCIVFRRGQDGKVEQLTIGRIVSVGKPWNFGDAQYAFLALGSDELIDPRQCWVNREECLKDWLAEKTQFSAALHHKLCAMDHEIHYVKEELKHGGKP